jgi:isochorismate hydrolase
LLLLSVVIVAGRTNICPAFPVIHQQHRSEKASVSNMSAQRVVGKLHPERTVLMICDIQQKFVPLIYRSDTIVRTCRYMTSVAATLKIPMICTQQYTKAFGDTVPDCFASPEIQALATPVYDKRLFSMITPEVKERLLSLPKQIDTYILLGIEAHVCLQQTCLDLLEFVRDEESPQATQVHVIADGVSSQQPYDRLIAIQRMAHAGAFITTAQSAAFMLMQSAEHENFKEVSQLSIKHMKFFNEFDADCPK